MVLEAAELWELEKQRRAEAAREESLMNSDQTTGMLDRAATVFATWFLGWMVTKHWISASDSAAFLPIIIAVPAAFWGWYKNRTSAIVASASNLSQVDSKKFAAAIDDPALKEVAKAAETKS